MRVDVYDRKNPDRLLGSIKRPSGPPPSGVRWRTAVYPPIHYRPPGPDFELGDLKVEVIDFQVRQREFDEGWKAERVFVTDCPLSALLKLDQFCLPGESEIAAMERRHYSLA